MVILWGLVYNIINYFFTVLWYHIKGKIPRGKMKTISLNDWDLIQLEENGFVEYGEYIITKKPK